MADYIYGENSLTSRIMIEIPAVVERCAGIDIRSSRSFYPEGPGRPKSGESFFIDKQRKYISDPFHLHTCQHPDFPTRRWSRKEKHMPTPDQYAANRLNAPSISPDMPLWQHVPLVILSPAPFPPPPSW
jgi:hypothetical protein